MISVLDDIKATYMIKLHIKRKLIEKWVTNIYTKSYNEALESEGRFMPISWNGNKGFKVQLGDEQHIVHSET